MLYLKIYEWINYDDMGMVRECETKIAKQTLSCQPIGGIEEEGPETAGLNEFGSLERAERNRSERRTIE